MFGGIQLGLFEVVLRRALYGGSDDVRAAAMKRWLVMAGIWQVVVLVVAGGYVWATKDAHRGDLSWAALPVSAVLGTGLPLQVVALAVLRAARR